MATPNERMCGAALAIIGLHCGRARTHAILAYFPSHANPANALVSPDHMAGPKGVAVVKGEIEFIGQICGGPTGIETRACVQLGGLCMRTDQNQTRNAVLFCSAAGTLGIPKSVVE